MIKSRLKNEFFAALEFFRSNYLYKIKAALLLTVLFAFQLQIAEAQSVVRGVVTDEDGVGLPGVNIIEKGTTNGTVSDGEGNYSVEVAGEDAVLIYSFIGYIAAEVRVGNQTTIDMAMMPDITSLQEVVVVGYGEQSKETLTGAVVAVQGKEIVKSPTMDVSNSLAGRLPGVIVIQESGEPGFDQAEISIRGRNTLGNNSPLYVIDGVPDRLGGIGRLDPQDIESISVLKDASAAIYGARAANGAIIVTTKRGENRKPSISYSFNQGWQTPTVVPNMSNAVEYANIMNEIPIYQSIPVDEWGAAWDAIKTTGVYDSPTAGVETLNANYSPEAIALHGSGEDPWGYPDTDWFGDAFKDWAPQNRHHIDVSGGTENVRAFASLGYAYQDAIYHESATYYEQYNFRTNLDAKVNDFVHAKLDFAYRQENRNFPTESAGAIFRMLMRGRPTEPEVWPNGKPGPDIENGQNPYVITTSATGYDKQKIDILQFTGSVDISQPWVEGLKLTLQGAVDQGFGRRKLWRTPWELYYWDRISFEDDGVTPLLEPAVRSNFTDPRLQESSESVLNYNLTALLNYDKTIGLDHTINILAGVTKEEFKGNGFLAFRRNYISSAVDQLFAGGTIGQNVDGGGYNRARLGYYGRVRYDFRQKYLAEFIWRYDGSYIFPESDRFGFFPGVMFGWNLTNEDFFNAEFVNFLKFRVSYGQMGNDQVFFDSDGDGVPELQEYAFLSSYSFGRYPINNQVVSTLEETVLANPNFTWERANNFNVGMDATLFNGRIDLVFEYFINKRDQILIQETGSTPASSGISTLLPPKNLGELENKGYDFNIRYNGGKETGLLWDISFGGGYSKNNIVFMDEVPGIPEYQKQEGSPIGAFLVYKSDGTFLNEEEIASNTLDYSQVTSQLIPGDMKFVDVNGDGVINADDQERIDETPYPKFQFGSSINFEYKNFDLSILIQGATGASIRIQTESGDIGNFLKYDYDNRWSIENPSSEAPRLASRGDTYFTGGNYGNNTYWLRDKDYVRLKNIELGYSLPTALLENVNIEEFRLYVSGLNLFTIDKNDVFDPEATVSSGVYYPLSKVINVGFKLTF